MLMDSFHYYRQISNLNDNQIVAIDKGDINGDNIIDTVYIVGKKPVDPNIRYIENIKIIIQDGKTNKINEIYLKVNSGYNPELSLVRFSKSSIKQIFISIDSNDEYESRRFYIYSFENNEVKKIFDFEVFNNSYIYDVSFLENFKVKIISEKTNKTFVLDITNKGVTYLSDIYNPDGTLKSKIKGKVIGLNNLYPVDINNDNIFELMAIQRVIGLYPDDVLATIETPLILKNENFSTQNTQQFITPYFLNT